MAAVDEQRVSDPELGGLQSTVPSEPSTHASAEFYESESCCRKFWGPLRAGGHTLREAGGSVLLPRLPFLIWRATVFLYLFASLIAVSVQDGDYKFFTMWSYTGLTFSFFLMTIASYRHYTQKSCYFDETRHFARWTVFFFQIFATAALYVTVVYWTVIFRRDVDRITYDTITVHVVNLVVVVIDMAMGLNMQFRLWNCLATLIYFAFYYAFMWVYFAIKDEWVYRPFDWREPGRSTGRVIAVHLGNVAGAIIVPIFMLLVNRLNRLVRKDPRKRKYQHHSDAS